MYDNKTEYTVNTITVAKDLHHCILIIFINVISIEYKVPHYWPSASIC